MESSGALEGPSSSAVIVEEHAEWRGRGEGGNDWFLCMRKAKKSHLEESSLVVSRVDNLLNI